ncbi:MAG: hypothetical protein NDI93_00755 [Pseudomonas sp.]|nr:hypothetical protein [Pseudomonas sp.]
MSSSEETQSAQAMRELGLLILMAPLLIVLPFLLLVGAIAAEAFWAVGSVWLLIALLLILGPETITEISIGKASIKRYVEAAEKDARSAREAKEEAEAIRNDLREVARLNIENTFVLNSLVAFLYDPNGERLPPAVGYVTQNLEALTPMISTDQRLVEAWQKQMRELMRRPPQKQDEV